MLKILMRRKELSNVEKELVALREKIAEFETREAELEKAIEEAETDEERAVVEEAVEKFESEKAEAEEQKKSLEEKVSGIEAEIAEMEKKQEEPAESKKAEEKPAERKDEHIMNKRSIFARMNAQERAAMFERDDVKGFLGTIRTAITNKRAITGAELTIPEVFLGLLRENVMDYSKLAKHVNYRQVSGNGVEVVMGTIPEAIWMECCSDLSELSLTFNDAEVGCWSVGGYFDICNATIQDSDIDLASEVMTVLGQAIGLAVDKAIVYGKGTRMPLGVVTRLAQTEAPADYPATARPWADLHTTNIKSIAADATGIDLFKEFMLDSAAAKGKYSRGEKVWVMNETTYTKLKAEGMTINASGVMVSAVEGTMPVVGGIVEVLDFMPDNVVVGGYFDLYLMAERQGVTIDASEHVFFLKNRTVFRGIARYDGQPVIAEGFVAIGLNGVTPDAEMEFAGN